MMRGAPKEIQESTGEIQESNIPTNINMTHTAASNNISAQYEGNKMETEMIRETTTMEPVLGGSEIDKSGETKKKVKCKRWPMCKNETCEFAHPKETVRNFFKKILIINLSFLVSLFP